MNHCKYCGMDQDLGIGHGFSCPAPQIEELEKKIRLVEARLKKSIDELEARVSLLDTPVR